MRVLTDWNATERRAVELAGAEGFATCDFGGAVVPAVYRSREELECVATAFELLPIPRARRWWIAASSVN